MVSEIQKMVKQGKGKEASHLNPKDRQNLIDANGKRKVVHRK